MNNLEKALCNGVKGAQKVCAVAADNWLWGVPESFLQHELARAISLKLKYIVFTEASPKKIVAGYGVKTRGRPPKITRKRFDMVVWRKRTARLSAVIEIKRTAILDPVRKDARKIKNYMRLKSATGVGYLLVYSEVNDGRGRVTGAARKQELNRRIKAWTAELKLSGWRRIGAEAIAPRDCEDYSGVSWSWAYSLYRLSQNA